MGDRDCDSVFGAVTFFAKKHSGELCGSNGLPLTPNSITIYGESQALKNISHPNLCEYVDIIRGKHERIIVVSECHSKSAGDFKPDLAAIKKLAHSVLSGLSHINQLGITHRMLSPENILITGSGEIKLFHYGLYHMTKLGQCVSFPIGSPKYMAPEVFLDVKNLPSGPKVDVWSLGMILAELALGVTLWKHLKHGQIVRRVLSLINCPGTVLERIANEHNCDQVYGEIDENLKTFIAKCLQINVRDRPTPEELLQDAFLSDVLKVETFGPDDVGYHIGFLQRVSRDNVAMVTRLRKQRIEEAQMKYKNAHWSKREFAKRSLKERYFLWQLAGGDVYSELKKQGMIKNKAPIISLPNLVLLEGTTFGERRDAASLLDLRVIPLPMQSLHHRIAQLSFDSFYPTLELKSKLKMEEDTQDAVLLPLIIREKDIEYQFHRVILFHRLLLGYPSNRGKILLEAAKDVTPFFRGDIWAALLSVKGDLQGLYEAIDKETPSLTDRQIDVDIPRCHQYNDLLASGEGHRKLKRILKAWVISHPHYVYWQGLDSLCAPFLYLNFNNEAQAYACLASFIPKYLHDFFLKDNSAVIQEYLAKFRHLVAFHDPELACHLDTIHFIPELFAIPWFLTVFSHVFPIHKILYLWDQLLLGDASFPFHIGLAILHQLRDTLLSSGFNECILLFSDLPEVDIERCVKDSATFYKKTPRSVTFRTHEKSTEPQDPVLDMTPIPLSQLQTEFCPRISATDLLKLLQDPEEKSLVVDIRNMNEFAAYSVPGSLNLPFNLISFSEHQMPSTKEGRRLEAARGDFIIVIGSGGENLTEFCHWLVHCTFPYVCILHGGIQSLKSTNII